MDRILRPIIYEEMDRLAEEKRKKEKKVRRSNGRVENSTIVPELGR
jgi:hypothetical protein